MRSLSAVRLVAVPWLALSALSGCGGSSTGVTDVTEAAPTATPASPSASPAAAASACQRMGDGVVVKGQCNKGHTALHGAVDGAIDALIESRPQLFNLDDMASPGSFRVVDVEGYYDGLVDQLGAGGLCAQMDPTRSVLQVKASNDSSEDFTVLTSKRFIARGGWTYQSTCAPASFPVSAADAIAYIRVSFFGFRCAEGTPEPDKIEKKLPVACDGYVTATPKNPDGRDVPLVVHGSEVSWTLRQGAEFVSLRPWPDQPFNLTVSPRTPGYFKLCATIQGETGCLGIDVVP